MKKAVSILSIITEIILLDASTAKAIMLSDLVIDACMDQFIRFARIIQPSTDEEMVYAVIIWADSTVKDKVEIEIVSLI